MACEFCGKPCEDCDEEEEVVNVPCDDPKFIELIGGHKGMRITSKDESRKFEHCLYAKDGLIHQDYYYDGELRYSEPIDKFEWEQVILYGYNQGDLKIEYE